MKTNYTIGEDQKTLIAKRSFNAPLEKVWHAWTDSDMLDKWWGPKPYDAITNSFSFTEGGEWRYVMKGPEGDAHHCINKYLTIEHGKEFTAEDSFANEHWEVNTEMPTSHWKVEFSHVGGATHICVTTTYNSAEELEAVSKMGMKEGFDMGLNQLEALLAE